MNPTATCSFPHLFAFPLAIFLLANATFAADESGANTQNWPQFRGPAGDGVVPGAVADLPLSWSRESNIDWRTELPGSGWSSPVIASGRVYLTAAIAQPTGDVELALLIVDVDSGELIHNAKVFEQPAEAPSIHPKNSHASPTVLVDGNRLFAHFGHQGTASLDLEGNLLWTNRELTFPPVHGNGGSPILVDDLLIFTCDGGEEPYIAALDADSGKLRWRTDRPVDAERKFSFCTPTLIEIDGEPQVICPGSDCVLAISPADGSIIWQVNYDGYSVVPKPIYAGGLVFIGTGYGPTSILAINPTARGNVTDSHVQWTLDRGAPKTPSMLAHDGLLYAISDDGILTVLEMGDGELVYKQRLGGNFSASPILAGDRIYLINEEGLTTVVQTGRQFRRLAENPLEERVLATPAVHGQDLIIRTGEALYRIGLR